MQYELAVYQDDRCVVRERFRDQTAAQLAARRFIASDPRQQVFTIQILDLRQDAGDQVVWEYPGGKQP